MESLLLQYGYRILFPISFIEGPIVTLVSGFLISIGYFDFWIVFAIVLLGDITCDILLYRIGLKLYTSKKVMSFVDRTNFLSENIKTMHLLWKNHPIKTMILGKNAFLISVAIITSAGVVKMPFFRFLLADIIGGMIQSLMLIAIGYYLGNGYILAVQYMQYPSAIISIILIIVIFTYHKVSKKITKKIQE